MRFKLVYALLATFLLAGSSAALSAQGFPAHCAGTYMMAEDGGATSLWTFERDGAFFATSSLQPLVNFSDQHGSWEQNGANGAKGVVLALVFNEDNTLHDVSRVDVTFHTLWATAAAPSPAPWWCASSRTARTRSTPRPTTKTHRYRHLHRTPREGEPVGNPGSAGLLAGLPT